MSRKLPVLGFLLATTIAGPSVANAAPMSVAPVAVSSTANAAPMSAGTQLSSGFVATATKPKSKPAPNIRANLHLSCTLLRTLMPYTDVWGVIWNSGNRSAMLHASITINGRYQPDPWRQLLGVGIRGNNLIIPAGRNVSLAKVFTANATVWVVIRDAVTNKTYFSKRFNPTTCWMYFGPIPLYVPPPSSKRPIPTVVSNMWFNYAPPASQKPRPTDIPNMQP